MVIRILKKEKVSEFSNPHKKPSECLDFYGDEGHIEDRLYLLERYIKKIIDNTDDQELIRALVGPYEKIVVLQEKELLKILTNHQKNKLRLFAETYIKARPWIKKIVCAYYANNRSLDSEIVIEKQINNMPEAEYWENCMSNAAYAGWRALNKGVNCPSEIYNKWIEKDKAEKRAPFGPITSYLN